MPNCPNTNCHRVWLWDWCEDTFRQPNGVYCKGEGIYSGSYPHRREPWYVAVLRCQCGTVLAFSNTDHQGEHVYNHEAWSRMDWEAPENSYSDEIRSLNP